MPEHDTKFENIACTVCRKPPALSGEACFASQGQTTALCRAYGKCRIDEKTEEQYDYVLTPCDTNVFLRACPGSGKTEVVGIKAAYEIRRWHRIGMGIAVLTFTNNAAEVIEARVKQYVGAAKFGYPHYVGTIDSWLHGYIANPFGYRLTRYPGKEGDRKFTIVEDSESSDWLNAFLCPTRYYVIRGGATNVVPMPIYANWLQCTIDNAGYFIRPPFTETNEYISDANYYQSPAFTAFRRDKVWLTLARLRQGFRETKERFWRAGLATYHDIEIICHRLLANNEDVTRLIAARFPMIIVDETQDLSQSQLAILQHLLNAGVVLNLIGDLNQAIYSFKNVDPAMVSAFAETNGFSQLTLTENHRSIQPIVDVCSSIIHEEGIIGQPYSADESCCICIKYVVGEEASLVRQFTEYLTLRGINTSASAIIARGNSLVSRLRPGLNSSNNMGVKRLALAVHLWSAANSESMEDALLACGRFMADTFFAGPNQGKRTFFCPQMFSSPLHWRLMLARLLNASLQNPRVRNLTTIWSQWATIIRQEFPTIAQSVFPKDSISDTLSFTSPRGCATQRVIESLDTTRPDGVNNIRITTIHKVKGETLDAVLLVSSATRGATGGYWTEWLDQTRDNGEHTRFAYVGSSRPKYLLAWAVPSLSITDETRLSALGFTIINDIEHTLDDLRVRDAAAQVISPSPDLEHQPA